MRHDILNVFRRHLNENFSKSTADKYYFAVKKLLGAQEFNSIRDINFPKESLLEIRTKSDFSAAKNGLLQLKKVFPSIEMPDDDFFQKHGRGKRTYASCKNPSKIIYQDSLMKKINGLHNNKLRYAYRLMLVSGLRVSEAAALTKNDIEIKDGQISVTVTNGKDGSNGVVRCMPDEYLLERLPEYLEGKTPDEKLFYSAETMIKRAVELGIECHDLRRVAAITYRNSIIKEAGYQEANRQTQAMLRHKRFSTTKRYLFNKKLKVHKREEE